MSVSGTARPVVRWRVPAWPRSVAGRLMRLELRRSTMLLLLIPIALLLGFTELRNNLGQAPLWAARSVVVQRSMELVGGIVAGVAAWTAGRDSRRKVTDLMVTTARPAWVRQMAAWAAVVAWSLLLYAAYVAVVFVVTARQATWGSPNWWPAIVGATSIVACSAVGFAAGALVPGRFTAPVVTIVVLLAPAMGLVALQRNLQWGRVSPVEDSIVPGTGVFIPYHAGLSIVQLMFASGVIVAAMGVLALPAAAGGPLLRRVGVTAVVIGVAAMAAGLALANSARQTPQGIVIPALHSAADDRPISYTQVCDDQATVPICVHPAYRSLLPQVAAALDPVLAQVDGLRGAPTRVEMGPTTANSLNGETLKLSGSPPVLYLGPSGFLVQPGTSFDSGLVPQIQQLRSPAADEIMAKLIGGGRPDDGSTSVADQVRQAITVSFWIPVGAPLYGPRDPHEALSPAVTAAAQRFTKLSLSTRHTWLVEHLAAVRSGQLTLADIP